MDISNYASCSSHTFTKKINKISKGLYSDFPKKTTLKHFKSTQEFQNSQRFNSKHSNLIDEDDPGFAQANAEAVGRFFREGRAALLELFPVVDAEAEQGVSGAAVDVRGRDPRAGAWDDAPLAIEQRDHIHQHVDEKGLATPATLKIIC